MITIQHMFGPLQGTSQSFDDDKSRIEFGRDPDQCDVAYPADDAIVGRRHFALVRKLSGDWAVDLYGQHFVTIDGLPAEPDQAVPSGASFRLGRSDGPGFTVAIERAEAPGKLIRTDIQEAPTPVRALVRRVAIAGVAIAVAISAATGLWIVRDRAERDAEREHVAATYAKLAEEQEQLIKQAAQGQPDRINPKAIDRMRRATYHVYLQDKDGRQFASGTAWVVGPDLLATNAHVAEGRDELKPGERMFVRQPGKGGAALEVIEHLKHPGFAAFRNYIKGKDTAYLPRFRTGAPMAVIGGLAYDVALLRVKGKLPKELILEVAPKDELLALEPGMPLASAGYPSENITGGEILPIGATPQVHFGSVSALTDYFYLPTDAEHNLLVHHSIGGTGGSSGSPVIGPSGRVVALINANNFLFIPDRGGETRAPSGALIAYAQRADILLDLIQKRAESALETDKSYWDRQMANFKRGVDAFGDWVLDKQKPSQQASAQVVSEAEEKLEAADMQIGSDGKKQRVKVTKLDLAADKIYTIFAYAEKQTPIKLYLVDANDQKVAESEGDRWFPSLKFKPAANGVWSLYVVGPDEDIGVTVKLYTWQSPAS